MAAVIEKARGVAVAFLRAQARRIVSGASLSAMGVSTGCCACSDDFGDAGLSTVFNPRHADVLIVSGVLNAKSAAVARRIYDQMDSPKYVIALGNCAIGGGPFAESPAVLSARDVLPVDVEAAGCPPDAAALKAAVRLLREKIKTGAA
mgnify:CR=1 FL=1